MDWFAKGVSQRRPIGIHGINFGDVHGTLFNHPPLVGYYLEVVDRVLSGESPCG